MQKTFGVICLTITCIIVLGACTRTSTTNTVAQNVNAGNPAAIEPASNDDDAQNANASITNTPATNANSTTVTDILTMAVIGQHNSSSDCWLLIDGKVYDATSYLPRHPGGSFRIAPFCGKDATEAFQTQGGKGSHPSSATAQLSELFIGNFNGPRQ